MTACERNHKPFGFCVPSLLPQNLTPPSLSPTLTSYQYTRAPISPISRHPRPAPVPAPAAPARLPYCLCSVPLSSSPSDAQQLGAHDDTRSQADRLTGSPRLPCSSPGARVRMSGTTTVSLHTTCLASLPLSNIVLGLVTADRQADNMLPRRQCQPCVSSGKPITHPLFLRERPMPRPTMSQ